MTTPAGTADPWAQTLLSALPDAALEVDGAGVVTEANELALELFGCEREELAGRVLEPLLPLDDLPLGADGVARGRLEGRRANGVPVLVEASVRAAGGRRLCVLRELNHGELADEAQRYFDAAFDNAPIGMALFNCDGQYVRVNAALCTLLGRSAEELIGQRDQELTHPDDRQRDLDAAWEILAGRYSTFQCEKRFLRPDGSVVWALANLTFLRDEDGRPLSWVGQFQDVTARRAAEQALTDSEERFRLAFEHAPIGIALVGTDGRWLRVNQHLCEITGYDEAQLLSRTFQEITHPDDLDADLDHLRRMLDGEIRTYDMEKRYIRADGSTVWILLSVALVRGDDGQPRYFISQIQDIDARKRAHGELERLARHDTLTGALNRGAWDDALARALAQADTAGEPLAIAMLDLNNFKRVNDSRGHDAGDRLLQDAAAAWRSQLRQGDLLARLGGDEFAVLLPNCDARHLPAIAQRLREVVPHEGGCAVGIGAWRPGEAVEELLRRVDRALYRDKPNALIGPRDRSHGSRAVTR